MKLWKGIQLNFVQAQSELVIKAVVLLFAEGFPRWVHDNKLSWKSFVNCMFLRPQKFKGELSICESFTLPVGTSCCKTSRPTWTSKFKLLYLSLQRTENFRFWWEIEEINWSSSKWIFMRNTRTSLKKYHFTLLRFVLPFSFQLKTYAFHVVKNG